MKNTNQVAFAETMSCRKTACFGEIKVLTVHGAVQYLKEASTFFFRLFCCFVRRWFANFVISSSWYTVGNL